MVLFSLVDFLPMDFSFPCCITNISDAFGFLCCVEIHITQRLRNNWGYSAINAVYFPRQKHYNHPIKFNTTSVKDYRKLFKLAFQTGFSITRKKREMKWKVTIYRKK